jgi:hypothetical protein
MLAALALAACPAREGAHAASLQDSMWGPHGLAESMVRIGDRVFLAGLGTTAVGPNLGGAVILGAADGKVVPGFPRVYAPAGTQVKCVVPDGAGGWFIGGRFTRVGGLSRSNVAHVLADGSVAAWNPGTNDIVSTLLLDGGVLYLGGTFTQVGGQARSRVAAVDAATGGVTPWNPNASGMVSTLAADASSVYLGGLFSAVGGQPRSYLAAVTKSTGAVTAFAPAPSDAVFELELDGGKLYVGGAFTTIGGQPRVRIAALDAATGTTLSWYPGPVGGNITDFELDGGLLYIAGPLGVNGEARNHLAAVDTATGGLTPLDSGITIGTGIEAISVDGGVVYAAGNFSQIGVGPGVRRLNLAAFDASSGALLPWDPAASSSMQSIHAAGGQVFAGGSMTNVNGVERRSMVALDAVSGLPLAFDPAFASGGARAVTGAGNTLFVGGDFNLGPGSPAPRGLTSYDATTLAWTGWSPNLDGPVVEMVADAGVLYVCGGFTLVDGQPRVGVAAFDNATGTLLPWYPGACPGVTDLAVTATEVVMGGAFSSLAGVPRTRLGSIDRATGAVTAWNPIVNATVRDVQVAGGRIYACGDFTAAGGAGRARMASFDAATGALTSWNPMANGSVQELAVAGGRAIGVGGFNLVNNSVPRIGIAEFDLVNGTATTWTPGFDGNGNGVRIAGGWIYVAHEIGGFDGVGRGFFTPVLDPQALDAGPTRLDTAGLRLGAPRPQPARGTCTLDLTLPAGASVTVEVLDVTGRSVARPLSGARLGAGPRRVSLDVSGLAPGAYVVRVRDGAAEAARRMIVVR